MKAVLFFTILAFNSLIYSQEPIEIQRRIDALIQEKIRLDLLVKSIQDSIENVDSSIENLKIQKTIAEKRSKRLRINELINSKNKAEIAIETFLKESPSPNSATLKTIKRGEDIKLIERDTVSSFYKIKFRKIIGYVPANAILLPKEIQEIESELSVFQDEVQTLPSSTSPKPTYNSINSSPQKSTPPKTKSSKEKENRVIKPSTTRSTSDCSAVQCSGTTKKGNRCRNRTTNCSGRCYQH